MSNLITATGKEYECDYFNPAPTLGQINLRVLNESLSTVVSVFSDARETIQMTWENQYAAQYTKLIAIVPEMDAVRVVLGKE